MVTRLYPLLVLINLILVPQFTATPSASNSAPSIYPTVVASAPAHVQSKSKPS